MEWYNLFKSHILDRGAVYHQDGYVSVFNMTEQGIEAEVEGTENYHVNIELDGETVINMSCDCPYAEDGKNCKHMAAVLFRFEEELYYEDIANEAETERKVDEFSWKDFYEEKREKAVELVNKIPEEDVTESDETFAFIAGYTFNPKLNSQYKLPFQVIACQLKSKLL